MHYLTQQPMKSAADGAFAFFIHLHPKTFGRSSVPTSRNLPPMVKKIATTREVSPWGLGAWVQLELTDALS